MAERCSSPFEGDRTRSLRLCIFMLTSIAHPRRSHDQSGGCFCQLKFTLLMSMETISISRIGRRSGPRV